VSFETTNKKQDMPAVAAIKMIQVEECHVAQTKATVNRTIKKRNQPMAVLLRLSFSSAC